MSREISFWGALRVHGELLMLGLEVARSTVSKTHGKRSHVSVADIQQTVLLQRAIANGLTIFGEINPLRF
jgi:hypothetical protein